VLLVKDNPVAVLGTAASVRVIDSVAEAVRSRGGRGACDWQFQGADIAREQQQQQQQDVLAVRDAGQMESGGARQQLGHARCDSRVKVAMTPAGVACAQMDMAPAAVSTAATHVT
jgi:hypothetical protein